METQIFKVSSHRLEKDVIKKAAPTGRAQRAIAQVVKKGGLVIFPTETVYGLGCDATNPLAILKIYKIKGRPAGKAFPILVKDFKMLSEYAIFNKEQKNIMVHVKTPTNFVLKAKNLSPLAMQNRTAAFRISMHPWIKRLFRYLDKPLIATSANFSGQKPLSDPRKYHEVFGEKAELIEAVIFYGINRKKKGSRVIDLTHEKPVILRK